jgi:Ribulose-5-phosphate 4-epimerase and related epimerases and aldolases
LNETTARNMLLNICTLLYERKITTSAGGNMSVRLEDSILITPSGKNKGLLRASEMVKVSMDGKVIGSGKPSIETFMHLALYNANPHINAVVHCHPLYCTILAVRGEKVKSDLTPEGVLLLGDVPMVGYFTPGSKELVDAVASNASSMAMIMERHGAITQGTTLEEAYNRMEELEFQANLQILAGNVKGLPKSEIDKIRGI